MDLPFFECSMSKDAWVRMIVQNRGGHEELCQVLGKDGIVVRRGGGLLACTKLGGLRRRLRSLGMMGEGRMTRGVGRTERRNSLSRGTRCSTTGSRRESVRTHVRRVRGVLGGTRIIMRSRMSLSGVDIKYGIGMRSFRFRRSVRLGVMNSARTGDLRNGVSGRSPMKGTLVNTRANSMMRMRVPTKVVGCGILRVREGMWRASS